jgi:RTX calcium-binding nonapeptide repeat (4 copies)
MAILQQGYFEGHTYYLLDNPGGTKWWNGDEAEAVALGGHLATIGSAAENSFVFNTFASKVTSDASAQGLGTTTWMFIGLSDQTVEGTYVWSSGAPTGFTNFLPNQQDVFPDQDFVGIDVGLNFTGGGVTFIPGGWHTVVSGPAQFHDVPYGVVELPFLQGTSGADTLTGAAGDDLLFGGGGKDKCSGGAGNDREDGGRGKDTLTGGAGKDVFDFNSAKDTGKTASGRDVITDFRHNIDDIDLKDIDASSKNSFDQAFKFIGLQDFHHKAGELHYFKIDNLGTKHDMTVVEGDTNGDGRADFQIELSHLVTLTKGDFVL